MNLKEIIEKLQASVPGLRQRANTALAGLPTLESLEVGAEVSSALRALTYISQEMAEVETRLAEILPAAELESTALVAATESKLIEDGTHVTVTDRDAQVGEAKKAGRVEAETEFKAAEAQRVKAAERRTAAEEKVGAKAASALSTDDLAGDHHEAVVTAMAGRVESMKAAGITEEGAEEAFSELVAIPFDGAGTGTFKARLASYASFAEALKKSSAPDGPTGFRASTPPVQGGTTEPATTRDLGILI